MYRDSQKLDEKIEVGYYIINERICISNDLKLLMKRYI